VLGTVGGGSEGELELGGQGIIPSGEEAVGLLRHSGVEQQCPAGLSGSQRDWQWHLGQHYKVKERFFSEIE